MQNHTYRYISGDFAASVLLIVASIIILAITSCGGGGSASVPGPDPQPQLASISFPLNGSVTTASDITVTGRTNDAIDIASISINGIQATSVDNYLSWRAIVPMVTGDNAINAVIEDIDGQTQTISLNVKKLDFLFSFPVGVDIDHVNSKIYFTDEHEAAVLSMPQGGGAITLVSDQFNAASKLAVDSANGRLLVVDYGTLVSLDIDTTVRANISEGFELIKGLFFDAPNNRAFVVMTSGLYEINLMTGDRTLLSGPTLGSGPSWSATDVSFDGVRALIASGLHNALISVDLLSGDRTIVSDDTTGSGVSLEYPYSLVFDNLNDRVLVGDREANALIAIDLLTGNREIVSGASNGDGLSILLPDDLALDQANNRVLIADSLLHAITTVDMVNGNREVIANSTVGGGSGHLSPFDLLLDQITTQLWVADSNFNSLIMKDFSNNAVTTISSQEIGSGPLIVHMDIDHDITNNRVLGAGENIDTHDNLVIAIDPVSGTRIVLSSYGVGIGPNFGYIRDIALDKVNNRLFVTNGDLGLMQVDLANGNRSVVSDNLTGSGPPVGTYAAVAVDSENNSVYVTDREYDSLLVIDPATGSRTLISDDSIGGWPFFSLPDGIALDIDNNRAFVSELGGRVLSVDLTTGERLMVSDSTTGSGPELNVVSDLFFDDENNLIWIAGSSGGVVMLVEPVSGDRIVILK